MLTLDLANPGVTDDVLKEKVMDNPDCTTLILSKSSVKDISCLSRLKKLTHLYISHTQVKDISVISGIPTLEEFYAVECSELTSLPNLKPLQKLHTVDFSGTPISDITPLSDTHALANISLVLTHVKEITSLNDLPKLQSLNLEGSKVTTQSLTKLKYRPSLSQLIVDKGDSLEDVAMQILKESEKLANDEKHVASNKKDLPGMRLS